MLDEAAYFLLGNIKIYYYGLHIALGALAAVIVLALCCRARRMPAGTAPLYAVLAMPLGVACSRVLFCLLDGRFRGIFSLRAMLCFWGGGHSMVGALLGAALAAVIAAKILAVPARRMLDMMAPALLVFIAFARVGEQYTEMLGRSRALVSQVWRQGWLVAGDEYALYLKTYVLEALCALILAAALLPGLLRGGRDGDTLLSAMLLLGCTQVLWESLRFDAHMRESFVSLQMLLYAVMFAVPLLVFACRYARRLGHGWPIWLALGVIALTAGGVIGLEFMIDRSGVSRFVLYAPYVLLLALPAVCGFVFKKRSNLA